MAKKKKRNHKYDIAHEFELLMKRFQELFYYGCDVDSWLPEIILYPYVSLGWKDIPTWYRIIAPPGSGKTAHLSVITDDDLSYAIDQFTPKSFVSGFRGTRGEDMSTLPHLNGKVLIVLDESTMLEQRQEDRNMVQSILRKAYDGIVSKEFGNIQGKVEYKVHFNILAAATPQIDRYFLYNQALGERYVNFRLQIPNRVALTKKAFYNQMHEYRKHHNLLSKRVSRFIHNIPNVSITKIRVTNKVKNILIQCATFIALIRTHVPRDATGRHITILPQPEVAGRLVQQMVQIAASGAILRGRRIIRQPQLDKAVYMALCSVPTVIVFMLYHAWQYTSQGKWFTIHDMVLESTLGRVTVARIIEDLAVHHILSIRKHKGLRGYEYTLAKYTADRISEVDLFKYYKPPNAKAISNKRLDRDQFNPTQERKKLKHKSLKRKGVRNVSTKQTKR